MMTSEDEIKEVRRAVLESIRHLNAIYQQHRCPQLNIRIEDISTPAISTPAPHGLRRRSSQQCIVRDLL